MPECAISGGENGLMGIRVLSIFVVLIGGTLGAGTPVFRSKFSRTKAVNTIWGKYLDEFFYLSKYFGSGVILATATVHLLSPANQALTTECLGWSWQQYPWAFGICLGVIYLALLADIVSQRHTARLAVENQMISCQQATASSENSLISRDDKTTIVGSISETLNEKPPRNSGLTQELASVLFLEFGVIFHSVFVGLTLAVSATNRFVMLFIVLTLHQTFEGLGLGSRVAAATWPEDKRWIEWVLVVAFGLTTPISIAIGLGVQNLYSPDSSTALITEGIFDAISAGILVYTALVELIANDFLHSKEMDNASVGRVTACYTSMCLGAFGMALLGRWI